MDLKSKIRVVENFPIEGISFKDVTTLLQDGEAYSYAIDQMVESITDVEFDIIVGPEARGFLIGAPMAVAMKKSFVPVRKPGKLPYETVQYSYELEYGADTLEIHADAIPAGAKVLIADDLLATGGTVGAVKELIEQMGGEVVGAVFLMELDFLKGRSGLGNTPIYSLIHYDS
jgi:adenine phosphoribosyltransferase